MLLKYFKAISMSPSLQNPLIMDVSVHLSLNHEHDFATQGEIDKLEKDKYT